MSVYGQIAGATPQSRGVKVKEKGEFLVRVDEIRTQQSNRQFGLLWVTEFTILKGTIDNPPGAKRSWVQQPERRPQTDPANIKVFVAACRGEEAETMALAETEYERIQSDEQPLKGLVLKLTTEPIQTQGGFDFVVHLWEHYTGPVPELTEAQVAAAAAAPAAAPPTAATPPAAPAAPAPPAAPSSAAPLTKEAWVAGQGLGQQHPTNPAYEWNPEHSDWGVRPKQ
jgi:hypothetical protein